MPNLFGIHRQQLLMQTGAVLPQAEPSSGVETLHVLWRAPGTLIVAGIEPETHCFLSVCLYH
jgi:hypothetical protein